MSSPRGAATAARPRITYFDWLRGASTLAVVVLHLLNKVLTDHPVAELGTPLVLSWTFLQIVLTRWAVPAALLLRRMPGLGKIL